MVLDPFPAVERSFDEEEHAPHAVGCTLMSAGYGRAHVLRSGRGHASATVGDWLTLPEQTELSLHCVS